MSAADWLNSTFKKPENSNGEEPPSVPAPPDVNQMPTTLFGKSFGQSKASSAPSLGLASAAPPGLELPTSEESSGNAVAGAELLSLIKPKSGASAPPGLEQPSGGYSCSSTVTNGKPQESARRYQGVIKSFDPSKGFGFVKCDQAHQEYGKDVFVHQSRINNAQAGDTVSFTLKLHKGAPQAEDVCVIEHTVGSSATPARQSSCPVSCPTNSQTSEQSRQTSAPDPSAPRYNGTLKSFSETKEFGFIQCDELNEKYGKDVFIHGTERNGANNGDYLSFCVKMHKGSPQAYAVQIETAPSQEEKRYYGKIRNFNEAKGFGFIDCPAVSDLHDGKDIFVHATALNGAVVGDKVSFWVALRKGEPQAQEVIVVESIPEEEKPQGKRYYGTIKSFNEGKGFGFIDCPEVSDGKDIFVHAKALNGADVGDKVSFSLALRKGAPQAQEVVVVERIPEEEKAARNSIGSSDSGWKYDKTASRHDTKKTKKRSETDEVQHVPTRDEKWDKRYDLYLSEEEVEKGVSDGSFICGELRIAGDRQTLAFVKPENAKKDDPDYCIRGKLHRNRAVHGDIVIIKPLEEDELVEHTAGGRTIKHKSAGSSSAGMPLDPFDEADDNDFDDLDSDEEIFFKPEKKISTSGSQTQGKERKEPIHPPAKVVAVKDFKGRNRVLTCTLHPNSKPKEEDDSAAEDSNDQTPKEGVVLEGDKTIKAIPFDKRLPWILIQINDTTKKILNIPGRLDKFRYWPVKIKGWDEYSILPIGHLKGESFGKVGSLEAEVKAALCESQLDSHDVDFEDEVLDETDNIVVEADYDFENEIKNRKDLRRKRICTIDPATAKDLDDAIHIDILGRQAEIGVHIADVGHFLKIGSALDTEAQRRTTSVYLIDRVLPMLPHALCNHLCSLNPNEAKLTFSAFFRLDLETGKLVDDPPPWFAKTVIKCCCRMNYEEVQDVLDGVEIEPPRTFGGHKWEDIKADLFKLYDVCGKVRRNRFEGEDGQGGALSITKVQMIFHTRDSEDGIPTGYHLEDHSASHWIIEELMLMANKVVARYIAASPLTDVAVLRNHQAPDPKKAEKLNKLLLALGITWWDASTAGNLHKSLKRINQEYGETLGICVETMAMINGMQQATYFPVGNGEPCWHYALDFDHYTHFTSPIRRYPDVMVHRVLAAVIQQSEAPMDMEGTERLCERSNEKKKNTRECKGLLDRAVFCCYLRAQKNWFYTVGTVLLIKKDEMSVYCAQLGKEKPISFYYANNPDPENPDFRMKPPPTLFMSGVDDELLLPETLTKKSVSHVQVEWRSPDGHERKNQHLRLLSNVPIVIIPTDTVPIDFAMFLVSPFHRYYEPVPADEAKGFEVREDDQEGVEEMWSAPHRKKSSNRDPGEFSD